LAQENHDLAALKINLDIQGTSTFSQNLARANRATKLYDTAIKAITAGTNKFERSLEDMNKISDLTEKKLQSQSKKAEDLKKQYERLVAEKGEDAKETQNMLIRYTKTVAEMKKTELALNSVNKEIKEQSSSYAQVAKDADKALSSIQGDLKALDAQYKATSSGVKNLEDDNKHLTKTFELQRQAANELSKKYAALKNDKGADAQATRDAYIEYQKAIGTMNKTKQSLDSVQDSLREQNSEFTKASQVADKALSSIEQDLRVLDSQFALTEAGAGDLGEAADMLLERSQHLARVHALEAKAVEELRKKYEAARREKGENDAATKESLVALNQAIGRMNRTEQAIESLDDQMDEASRGFTVFGRHIRISTQDLEDWKNQARESGRAVSNAVAIGTAGAAVGVTKLASDMEGSQKRIQSSLDVTEKEAAKLTKTARSMWKDGFGDSMGDVENALIKVRQNMQGLVKDSDLKQVTQDSMQLAQLFETDVNEVTRAGANLMRGFGIDSKEAFDLMAWGARNGLNFSQEMFDNLAEYSPLFAKMGFSAEEYFQLLEKGSKAGVYNLDFINDAMKEMQIRLKDGSDTTAGAMSQLSKGTQDVWKQFTAGKATVKDVHNAVIKDLKGMDDQTAANNIGVALYGTKFEDLESTAMYAMGNIDGSLKGVDGSMSKANSSMDTMAVRAKKLFREFLDAVTPLGQTLLDVAERIMPKIESGVATLTGWFNKLSPAMQDTVAVGGLVAGIGLPIISAFGSVIGIVRPLIGLLGAGGLAGAAGTAGAAAGTAAGGAGLLGGALSLLTGPVGWTIGILGALGLGYLKLDKEMDKPLIKTKAFGDEVSKSTQKSINSYLKLEEDATNSLNRFAWGQQVITEGMAKNVIGQYQSMNDKVLQEIDKRHSAEMEKARQHFANSNVLTEQQEAEALAKMQADNEKKKEEVQGYQDRIAEIWNTASKEKRSITAEERAEIESLTQKMRKTVVETVSKSQKEQEAILENLKNNSSAKTAQQAAEVVKNSKKQKDKSVKNADDQYKESIAAITYMRDEAGVLTDEQAKSSIEDAEKTRDKSIAAAEKMHEKVVKEAKNQAEEHVDEINWQTGEVLDGWDKMAGIIYKVMDWISGLFDKGSIKAPPVFNKAKKAAKKASGRATGTPNGGVPYDQVALTGEEGPELVKDGRTGSLGLVGVNGPQHAFLSKGSSVLPAHHTKNALKKYGITPQGKKMPAYADGIGIDNFDMIMQGPSKIWDTAVEKFGFSDKDNPDFLKKYTGSMVGYTKNLAMDKIQGWIDEAMQLFEGSPISEYYLNKPWRYTSPMGPRWGTMHNGIDLAAPAGFPIKSLTDGTVSQVLRNNPTAGNGVRIKSGDKEFSYIHMIGIPQVVEGQKVKAGQILGGVGNTGASKGNHLDLKIKQNGKYIDPWEYLNNAFSGGAMGIDGNITSWRGPILRAAKEMKESISSKEVKRLLSQIQRESGGNQRAVQGKGVRDINMLMGNPAKGLLQYIPQTFAAYKMKGHGNIFSGYDQLLAFFNNTTWRRDLPTSPRGWSPRGKRKYAKGGLVDSHQVAELGENGYDEYVITTEPRYRNRSLALLQSLMKDLGVYNPIPKVAPSSSGTGTKSTTAVQEQPIQVTNVFHVSYAGLPDRESIKKFMDTMEELAQEKEEQQLRSRGTRRR
jgi:phage-related minor tail protein/SLT domain-containing protein/murein DD-endopeptidase MepM/ murein hydrolase activator NlpD